MNEPQSTADSNTPSSTKFNLGRVVKSTLALVLMGGLAFAAVEYWNNRKATLVKVTGRVMWNGQPVTLGAVTTEHSEDPLLFAIGALGSDGKFELSSNGEPGAALGTHKVVVASYGLGASRPPLVPQKYLKASTTPLSIVVTGDASKNHFELEVVGEKLNDNPGDGAGNGPRGGGPRDSEESPTGGGRPELESPAVTPPDNGAAKNPPAEPPKLE